MKRQELDISIYKDISLAQVPRILGLGDRNKDSKTFGCFDRYYWQYKLLDFPNARFQEVCLLLALLYSNRFPMNIYYGKRKVLEWIEEAIEFWSKIQNLDGSVNECYPQERSFCATSFTTYTVTEAMLILSRDSSLKLEKTASWLIKNQNISVSNQMSSSLLAIYNIYLLTGKEKYREIAEERYRLLVRQQAPSGFFPEYGGYDTGYQTITISCLAKYYKKTKDKNVLKCLKKADAFLENKIRADGSFSLDKTSRRMQHIYPHGLKIIDSRILGRHLKGLRENKIINPGWLDDRYVIPLTIDYLQTYLETKDAYDNK